MKPQLAQAVEAAGIWTPACFPQNPRPFHDVKWLRRMESAVGGGQFPVGRALSRGWRLESLPGPPDLGWSQGQLRIGAWVSPGVTPQNQWSRRRLSVPRKHESKEDPKHEGESPQQLSKLDLWALWSG